MMNLKSITRSIAYVALLLLPGLMMANKPYHASEALEINNLESEPTLRTIDGKIGRDTRVVRYLYDVDYGPLAGTAEDMARTYLQAQAARFGITDAKNELRVKQVTTSPGGQHVTFYEVMNDIPVYQSEIVVTVDNQNRISFVASNFRPNLDIKSTTPSISADAAINSARGYLNVSGKLLAEQKATLMIFDGEESDLLTYRVQVPTEKPMGDWEVFVDASSGEIVHVKDRMMYENGTGMVWDPDPITTAETTYAGDYVDNNDQDNAALNDERVSFTLKDITLDGGVYKLEGPYAVVSDEETPSDNFPELTDPDGFNYTRSEQGFEAVMVYFHIDSSYRHLMSLGYDIPGLYTFAADPHGLDGADNAHYVPSGNFIAFGEGGVDDAEDADVIWHEYGHAIQENITGGMTYSGETMSLQEGASDYWTASYSRAASDYMWAEVFTWDGHNEFWPGRNADLDWVYPDDYVSGHDGGQIFSSAMMHMWPELGRDIADQLFIEAHYIWGTSPGLQDAAQAVIQADINLYGGTHMSTIVSWFDYHGLVDADDYIPTIVHEPLSDTEDMTGPYTVTATITGSQPLNEDSVFVYWSTDTTFSNEIVMTSMGSGEYSADIPGGFSEEVDVQYYISATDSSGATGIDPAGAPSSFHEFHVGTDNEPPMVDHSPLRDQPIIRWPASVSADISDNIGISNVTLTYHINNGADETVTMTDNDGDGEYTGTFNSTQSEVSVGDSVFYYITATDASSASNQTVVPETGTYGFEMIDALGVVLVINDDEDTVTGRSARIVTDKGVQVRAQDEIGRAASEIISHLVTLGYVVDSTGIADYDAYNWDDYDVVINSSGRNTSTLENEDYRNALIARAQAGGKILIEGGEVGYDWDSDAAFAGDVLHIEDWEGDDSGDILLRSQYSDHPFVTTPNTLSNSIAITYEGFGDQDAVLASGDAISLFSTSDDSAETGLLIYDDNPNPTGGQIVYFPFDWFRITDQPTRLNLLENAMQYLTVTEADPTGSIAGTIDLTDTSDDSGVEVSITGPGTNESTTTASDGSYSFGGLYNGPHVVTVSHSGYFPYSQTDTLEVTGDPITGVDFSFDPIAPGTVSGTISVTGADPEADSVVVEVLGTDISDTTGTDGTYSLTGIQPGPITVRAQKVGYLQAAIDTTMPNGGSLTLDMTLPIDIAPPFGLSAVDGLDTHVELSWNEPVQGGDEVTEDFETGAFPPAGWTHTNTSDTTWQLYDDPDYVYEGMYAVGTWWAYQHQDEWIMTPEFTVPGAGELNFWSFAYQGSTNDDHYYVKISTDGGNSWTELLDLSDLPVYDNPDFNDFNNYQEPYTIDLSGYAGQNVQIAWHAESAPDDGLWYIWMIDNVTIQSTAGVMAFDESEFLRNNNSEAVQKKILDHSRELASSSPIKAQPSLASEWQNRKYTRGVSGPFGAQQRSIQSLEGYELYRSTSPDIDPMSATPIESFGTDVLSFDDTNVTNGITYYYVVTANYGADGESPPSNEVSATPYNVPPSMPTNFTATNTGTTVDMAWDANPEDDVIRYIIYEKVDQGDWVATDSTSSTTLQKTVEDNHVYQYKITARDDEGAESDFSETVVLPIGNIPPENLAAEGGMDGHILLEWNEPGTQFTVPDSILYDFEDDNGGFVATNDWAHGAPTSGPGAAYSGQNVWGTVLDGPYTSQDGGTLSTLTTPEINLSGFTAPLLRFQHWHEFESASTAWDGGNVKISTDGGSTWTLITPVNGYPDTLEDGFENPLETEPGFAFDSDGWEMARFDLSAYAGETVTLRFSMGADNWSTEDTGWYLDDVVIIDNTTVMNLMAENSAGGEPGITKRQNTRDGLNRRNATGLHSAGTPNQISEREGKQGTSLLRSIEELTGYKIYRSTSTITDTATATLVATVGDTMLYDDWGDGGNGLDNGTTYYYVVVADYGTDGVSAPSNEASATPVNEAPLPPSNLQLSNSDVSVTLDWDASPSYDVAGYIIYAKQDAGEFVAIDSTSNLTYTYDVEDNHVYSYEVSAYDADGAESGVTETVFIAIGNIPPENLTAEGGMDGHIQLEWNAPGTQFTVPDSLLYDFEDDNGGFTGEVDWAWGSPDYTDGPAGAYSGENIWGTNLTGDFTNSECMTLVSPELDLSNYTSPLLRFHHWYDFGGSFDAGNVKISVDGGNTWTLIQPVTGYPGTVGGSTCIDGEEAYVDDTSGEWVLAEFNLSAYAGETVLIGWQVGTTGVVPNPGWYVDDVVLTEAAEFVNLQARRGNLSDEEMRKQHSLGLETSSGQETARSQSANKNPDRKFVQVRGRNQANPSVRSTTSPQDLMGYKVYRSTESITDTADATLVASLGDTLMYDDWGDNGDGLDNGTTYYYVLVANYGVDGNSAASTEASATPVNSPPMAPSNLQASNADVDVTLSWDASPSYDVEGYYIYEKMDDGDFALIDSTANLTYSYTAEDNHVYSYKVSTYDRDGAESDFTETVFIAIGNIPPEDLAAESGLDGHVLLEWNAPGTQFTVPDSQLFDFEDGAGDFVGSGGFALGEPTNGPGAAHSGTNAWGTNLTSDYDVDMAATVTTPDFNLSNYDSPVLRFFQWFDTEGYFDGGNVKISTDEGNTWTLIEPVTGYPEDATSSGNAFIPGEPAFSGHDIGEMWHRVEFNLSAYSGESTVRFRFDFGTDGSVTYPGWFVDDLVVAEAAEFVNLIPRHGDMSRKELMQFGSNFVGNTDKTARDQQPNSKVVSDVRLSRKLSRPSQRSITETQDLVGYKIYRSTSSITDTTSATLVASLDDTLMYDDWGDGGNGLQNGTTYYYVVVANYGADGQSAASTEATGTPQNAPPVPPTNLTASNSGTDVTLTWDASVSYDVAGYIVYQQLEGGDWTIVDSTSNVSHTFSVEDNHFYGFQVSAYDQDGAESDYSNSVFVPIGNLPPEALEGESGLDGHVALEWDAPGTSFFGGDTMLYDFEEDNGEFTGSGQWAWGAPTTGPGAAYSGTNVWAINLAGEYDNDLTASLTTVEIDLSSYDNPALGFYQWFDTEGYFDGGNVKISIDGGASWNLITPVSGYPEDALSSGNAFLPGEPAFSGHDIGEMWHRVDFNLGDYAGEESVQFRFDFGSDGSVTYPGWYVDNVMVYENESVFVNGVAINSLQEFNSSKLAAPSATSASMKDTKFGQRSRGSSAHITRDAQDLVGYKLYRSTSPGVETTEANLVATVSPDSLEYDDWNNGAGLENGTTYYYVVAADYGTDGVSSPSNEISAMPENAPPPAATGLHATIDGMNVMLDWDDSPAYDMDHYRVYRASGTSDEYTHIDDATESEYTDTVPIDGAYRYRVMVMDEGGEQSEMSPPTSFMMVGHIPPIIAAEGGHENMVPIHVRPWTPGEQVELIYDDGSAENGVGSANVTIDLAVRMSPGGSGEVSEISFYWTNSGGAAEPVVPAIWSSNTADGVPNQIIWEGAAVTPNQEDYWMNIPVANVTFDGEFWVGVQFQTPNGPYLGVDENGNLFLRSYVNPGDGNWVELGVAGLEGNLMVRTTAVVLADDGSDQLISMRPVTAYNPVYREAAESGDGDDPWLMTNNGTLSSREFDANSTTSYETAPLHEHISDYSAVESIQDITHFEIYRRADYEDEFSMISTLGADTSLYEDTNVGGGTVYEYYAKSVYAPGGPDNTSPPSDTVSAEPTGDPDAVGDEMGLPTEFAMSQNYPNPFNPTTTIKYQLPQAAQVRVEIYNMLGQRIATLVNTQQEANYYTIEWDGTNDYGQTVGSGVYFYHIRAGQDFQKTKKMILLR